ncbi:hypothetical protein A0J48_010405 [Sphaerospermopsis aphanizomenoides BCCUSP55]|uniref:hypothetical protein n=1 Tax=Sphaerospermopsis aphanizomenoides TaxID=459663 RepID=UPI001902D817|nr:hypothetical protein [Sphaerospermopsis aphanizomenoides]MBK1987946.1 hypothetical protein [Sphaerospermopsis aphanizomenoides BCCUSP55]
MSINFLKFLSSTVLLSLNTAYTSPPENQALRENSLITEYTTVVANHKSQKNRPSKKTTTISIEGEKTQITLQLYQSKNLLTTYFPDPDFRAESTASGEGQSVRFIVNFGGIKNENAYVHIAFLNNLKTLGQVRNFINGKRGLIASNKWRVVSRTANVPYPWAKEKINFSKGKDIVGEIYLGEQKGKAFYVITHYPVEYGDGFAPREDVILRNLEIGG